MDKTEALAGLLKNRQALYTFLGGLYLNEVDAAQLAAMQAMDFPQQSGVEKLDEGYRLLAEYLETATEESLDELAVEYARVFLSAGVAQGLAAFPYESIYTGKQRLMAQKPEGEAAVLYAAKGLQASEDNYRVPNDHIGLELTFMAHLCGQAADALEQGDSAALAESMGEQKSFLQAHLLNWCNSFCHDLERYAGTAFYKGLANITLGFLELERGMMEEGEALWAIA